MLRPPPSQGSSGPSLRLMGASAPSRATLIITHCGMEGRGKDSARHSSLVELPPPRAATARVLSRPAVRPGTRGGGGRWFSVPKLSTRPPQLATPAPQSAWPVCSSPSPVSAECFTDGVEAATEWRVQMPAHHPCSLSLHGNHYQLHLAI